jgi:hypothetical protein
MKADHPAAKQADVDVRVHLDVSPIVAHLRQLGIGLCNLADQLESQDPDEHGLRLVIGDDESA